MADKNLTLGVVFSGRISKELESSVERLEALVKGLNGTLGKIQKSGGVQALASLAKQTKETSAAMTVLGNTSKAATAIMATSIGNAGKSVGEFGKAMTRATGNGQRFVATLQELTKHNRGNTLEIKDAEKAMYKTDGVLRQLNREVANGAIQTSLAKKNWKYARDEYVSFKNAANLTAISQEVLNGKITASKSGIQDYIKQLTGGRVAFDEVAKSSKKLWPEINKANKAIDDGNQSWQNASRQQSEFQVAANKSTKEITEFTKASGKAVPNANALNKEIDAGTRSWQSVAREQSTYTSALNGTLPSHLAAKAAIEANTKAQAEHAKSVADAIKKSEAFATTKKQLTTQYSKHTDKLKELLPKLQSEKMTIGEVNKAMKSHISFQNEAVKSSSNLQNAKKQLLKTYSDFTPQVEQLFQKYRTGNKTYGEVIGTLDRLKAKRKQEADSIASTQKATEAFEKQKSNLINKYSDHSKKLSEFLPKLDAEKMTIGEVNKAMKSHISSQNEAVKSSSNLQNAKKQLLKTYSDFTPQVEQLFQKYRTGNKTYGEVIGTLDRLKAKRKQEADSIASTQKATEALHTQTARLTNQYPKFGAEVQKVMGYVQKGTVTYTEATGVMKRHAERITASEKAEAEASKTKKGLYDQTTRLTNQYPKFGAEVQKVMGHVQKGTITYTEATGAMKRYAERTIAAEKQMNAFTNASKKAAPGTNELNKALDNGTKTLQQAIVEQSKYQAMQSKGYAETQRIRAATEEYASAKRKLTNDLKSGNISLSEGVKKLQTIQTAYNNAVPPAQRLGTATSNLEKPFTFLGKQIGSVNGAVDRLKAAFKVTAAYGAASTAIYALVTALKSGAQAIVDYDQGLKNLQAITGATGAEVAAMGDTILDVARTTKFSSTEIAEGMVLLGQSGFSAGEAMDAIQAAANLATGTLSNMKLTTDLLTTTIRAFNLDTIESGRVADVMANAINKSKLTIDKLRISFSYIAATASQAGLSLEETAASMMVLANNGLRASTIGTGLRQVLSRLLSPNTKLREAYEAHGIALDQINPKTVGYQEALRNLSKVLYNAETNTVDVSKAFELFGLRGAQAAAIIVRDFAGGAFQTALASVFEVGTSADRAAKQAEGLGVKMKNLADRAKNVAVAFGGAGISGAIGAFVDVLRAGSEWLESFANNAIGQVIIKTGLLVGAFAALRGAAVFLISAIKGLAIIGTVQTAMAALMYHSAGAVTGLAKLSIGFKALWVAMAAHPIGLIVTGITLAVAVFSQLIGASEKLANTLSQQAIESEKVAKGLSIYAETIGLAEEGSDEYNAALKRFAETYPKVTQEILDMNKAIDLADIATTDLVRSMNELAAIKAWESVKKTSESLALYKEDLERAQVAGRNLYEILFKQGDLNDHLAEKTAKVTGAQNALTQSYKFLVEVGALTIDQALELIDAMGLEEKKAQEVKDAFVAHFSEVKIAGDEAAGGITKAFEGVPDAFRNLYNELDSLQQANLLKAVAAMQKEVAAYRKSVKDMGIAKWDADAQIDAIQEAAYQKFVATLDKTVAAEEKAAKKSSDAIAKELEKRQQEYQKFADQIISIEEKLAEDQKKIRQSTMTDAQKDQDNLLVARAALTLALKAAAEAETEAERDAAFKKLEAAREMYSKILDTALSGAEKLKESRTSTTTHSITEAQKESDSVKAAYENYMDILSRRGRSYTAEIQRQKDEQKAYLDWRQAENDAAIQKEVAELVKKYGVESQEVQNYTRFYTNTYGVAEAAVKLGIDETTLKTISSNKAKETSTGESYKNMQTDATGALKVIADALVAMQEKFSKPIEPKVITEPAKTDVDALTTSTKDLTTAVNEPKAITLVYQSAIDGLQAVEEKAKTAIVTIEKPVAVDLDPQPALKAEESIIDKAEELTALINGTVLVPIVDQQSAIEAEESIIDKAGEVKAKVEAPMQPEITAPPATSALQEVQDKSEDVTATIEEPSVPQVDIGDVRDSIDAMEEMNDEFTRQAEEPKSYIIDDAGVKVFFDETTGELKRVREEIVDGKEYNIQITVAEAEMLRLEKDTKDVTEEIEKDKEYVLDKGVAESDVAKLQEKLGSLKEAILEDKAVGLDTTAADAAAKGLETTINGLTAKIEEKRKLLIEIEGSGSATLPITEKVSEVQGLLDDLAGTAWDATVNIAVTGMDLLREAKSMLEAMAGQVYTSTHQIIVEGLDALKDAIGYQKSQDGLMTTSTHRIKIEGEGSTVKPISEKVSEVSGLLDDLSDQAEAGSTYTVDFEGSSDTGTGGLTEKVQEVKDLVGSLPAAWQSYFNSLSGQYKLDFYEYAQSTSDKAEDLADFMEATGSSQGEINSVLAELYAEDLAEYKENTDAKAQTNEEFISSLPGDYQSTLGDLAGQYVGDFLAFAESTQKKVDENAIAMASIGRSEAEIADTKKLLYKEALDDYLEGIGIMVDETETAADEIEGGIKGATSEASEASKDMAGTWIDSLNDIIAKIGELIRMLGDLAKANENASSNIVITRQRGLTGTTVVAYDKITGRTLWTRFEPYREGGSVGFAQGGSLKDFGGKLSGYGGGDTIPAMLEKGEFVIRKEAVQKYGTGLFSSLNGMVQKFAQGGSVVQGFATGGITDPRRWNFGPFAEKTVMGKEDPGILNAIKELGVHLKSISSSGQGLLGKATTSMQSAIKAIETKLKAGEEIGQDFIRGIMQGTNDVLVNLGGTIKDRLTTVTDQIAQYSSKTFESQSANIKDAIKEIDRSAMSAQERWEDTKKTVEALRQEAATLGNTDEAIEKYQEAADEATKLLGEVTNSSGAVLRSEEENRSLVKQLLGSFSNEIESVETRRLESLKQEQKALENIIPVFDEFHDAFQVKMKPFLTAIDDMTMGLQRGASMLLTRRFVQARSAGGQLPGFGGGDTVPAMLENGEFVIRKEAVKKYGSGLFENLNRMVAGFAGGGQVAKFATGGVIPPGPSVEDVLDEWTKKIVLRRISSLKTVPKDFDVWTKAEGFETAATILRHRMESLYVDVPPILSNDAGRTKAGGRAKEYIDTVGEEKANPKTVETLIGDDVYDIGNALTTRFTRLVYKSIEFVEELVESVLYMIMSGLPGKDGNDLITDMIDDLKGLDDTDWQKRLKDAASSLRVKGNHVQSYDGILDFYLNNSKMRDAKQLGDLVVTGADYGLTLEGARQQAAADLAKSLGLASGGKLPGFGGGDTVPAMLEKGEFVIRKEAVKKYGANLFSNLNSMVAGMKIGGPVARPGIPAFSTGGGVGTQSGGEFSLSNQLHTINLSINNAKHTLYGDEQAVKGLVKTLRREQLVTA